MYCTFVFDTDILDALPSRRDRRVHFIHGSLQALDASLRARGGALIVRHGRATQHIPALAQALAVGAVHANHDYEPAAKARDQAVARALTPMGIQLHLHKDPVIFDGDAVCTRTGTPFTVFTLHKNAWRQRLLQQAPPGAPHALPDLAAYCCAGRLASPPPHLSTDMLTLADIDFATTSLAELGITPGMPGARALWKAFAQERIQRYGELRDCPARRGVSYLSVHLRFGTIAIRALVRHTLALRADACLEELIWREFCFITTYANRGEARRSPHGKTPHCIFVCVSPVHDPRPLPTRDRARIQTCFRRDHVGRLDTRRGRRASRAATHASMPRCGNCRTAAGCTTACACSRPRSCAKT